MTDKIIYVGVDDTDIDLFESQYIVPNGMSYNSYIIMDERVAILDTVDPRKSQEWLANVEKALADRQPDYLIVQHLEPDHSGTISQLAHRYPEMRLVMSAKAAAMLPQFFPDEDLTARVDAVKEGAELQLGSHCLHFVMAPMVHWPEVMVSYESTERILFSADAFGKFGALCNEEEWDCEARRYYFNICGRYGVPVQTLLKKAAKLDIATICPLHGPILSGDLSHYISLYNTWSLYQPESEGALVAYASIHGGTREAAELMAEQLKANGAAKVAMADLSRDDVAEAVEDAFRYPTLVLAAASYDGGVFTPMHNFLHVLQTKTYQNRRVALIENGSWAPSAARVMREMLSQMKNLTIVEPTITIRSRMTKENREQIAALAKQLCSE